MELTNMNKLSNHHSSSIRIFADTINDFRFSQGFYGRLYRQINDLDEYGLNDLIDTLSKETFGDMLDVIMWLES